MSHPDGDYSDYSDVEGEEEYKSSRGKKSSKAPQKGGYSIRNALKVPRATTYTAQALYGAILAAFTININVTSFYFQTRSIAQISTLSRSIREVGIQFLPLPRPRLIIAMIAVVWPEAKQIGIIDSILRNFYIPPVIFC